MKRIHDARCSVSLGVTNQQFDRSFPYRKPREYNPSARSSDHGRLPRSTGLLLSGLLIVGLFTITVFATPTASRAAEIAIGVSVRVGPPPLPVYAQPVCPGPGYIWTPGYWAYDTDDGYYWVPGTWVMAPAPGMLWTPGYWGWSGAAFIWHSGYWGPHVGFYGGINYGFGYPGWGFEGGEWRGRDFFYNRSVNNFGGAHITNVYYRHVENNHGGNHVSYNGGAGGLNARPGRNEFAAEDDRHFEASSLQRQHEMAAHNDRSQFASVNHGRPEVAATGRPGEFRGAGAVRSSHAGGAANPGGYHSANPGRETGSSGAHNPHHGGGGAYQGMTTHQNSPAVHGSGPRQAQPASGQFQSGSPSRYEGSRGPATNHPAEVHQPQPQQHNSRSAEGGRGEGHKSDRNR